MTLHEPETGDASEFAHVEALLLRDYSPPLTAEEIRHCLIACIDDFSTAKVRAYLSVLVEREARIRLRTLRVAAVENERQRTEQLDRITNHDTGRLNEERAVR